MKKKGYTLSEVLVAIGVIGVIIALVMPVMINSYANKLRTAQLKKVYSQIVFAAKAIISEEAAAEVANINDALDIGGDTGFYRTSAGTKTSDSTKGAQYFLDNYLRTSKKGCGSGDSNKCIAAEYKSDEGSVLGSMPNQSYCVQTVNGAAICMMYSTSINKSIVIVDVNGPDKPNITGKDVFSMYVADNGDLKDYDANPANCNKNCTDVFNCAAGCFTKVAQDGGDIH